MPPPKVAFVYHNARSEFAARVARGDEPDTTLLGQNHLWRHGVDARIHDPVLTRRAPKGVPARLIWNLREVTLPWELRHEDAVVTPLSNIFPLAARARLRRPRIVLLNYALTTAFGRSGAARRRLIASIVRSVDAVVSVADAQAETLAWQTGVRPRLAGTIPYGVDADWFSPRPGGADDPFVLSVGKDLARDYTTLAEAIDGLDARVLLAAYPRNLEGVRIPANASVRIVGSRELRELYARAACVVLPQRNPEYPFGSEGGGVTALLEAMAMAKPVVLTARPVLCEYVRDGETALVVPPEDPPALRTAIERVLADSELADSLGAAGRARVETHYTTRRFAERLAPILRRVAAE